MFKSLLSKFSLSIFVLLALAGALFAPAMLKKQEAHASSTVTNKNDIWSIHKGVPYSLYYENSNVPNVYNVRGEGDYIVLSSDPLDDSGRYHSTINLSFGNENSDVRLISTAFTPSATLNGQPIFVGPSIDQIVNNYVYYNYQINLSTANMYWDNLFDDPIDIADRVGRYEFNFIYSTLNIQTNATTTDTFSISFNVIDFASYGKEPIKIYNAGDAQSDIDGTENIYLYNFNQAINTYGFSGTPSFKQTTKPVVMFDASKFGINYSHMIRQSENSTTSTNWKFVSFTTLMNREQAANSSTALGTITGSFELQRENSSSRVAFNVYKLSTDNLYGAIMEFGDLGDYSFSIDLLLNVGNTYEKVQGVSKDIEDTQKYLSVFGYVANYYDQSSRNYLELTNYQHTQANAFSGRPGETLKDGYAYHNYVTDHGGPSPVFNMYANIPVTNQAPIRFNYYGILSTDLTPSFNTTGAMYRRYDTLNQALNFLNNAYNAPNSTALDSVDSELNLNYSSGSTFNFEGYYVVKVVYTLKSAIPKADGVFTGYQYFIFQIDNSLPEVWVQTVNPKNDSVESLHNQYTNQNLRVVMPIKNNTFNAAITVTYRFFPNFLNQNVQTGSLSLNTTSPVNYYDGFGNIACNYFVMPSNPTANFTFPFDRDGYAYIYITYGPSKTTFSYRYVIDSTNFSGIVLNEVGETASSGGGSTIYDKRAAINQTPNSNVLGGFDMAITSQTFSLAWTEKPWASELRNPLTGEYTRQPSTATVYRLPLISNLTDIDIELLETTISQHGLTNGHTTSSMLELVSYQNSFGRGINGSDFINMMSENFVAANGIYLFYIEDLAGNFFYRLVMLDRSASSIIQETYTEGIWKEPTSEEKLQNPNNFVKNDTRLTFGTHKLIHLSTIANDASGIFKNYDGSFMDALNSTSYFAEGSLNNYIAVPVTKVEYRIDNSLTNSQLVPAVNFWRVTLYATDQSPAAPNPQIPWGPNNFYGEHCYYFTITNANNIANSDYFVEMNFDNAEGQFWARNSGGQVRNIPNRNGTNLSILEFWFRDSDDDQSIYSIESISYSLYGFNYTALTPSYPFSPEPEIENQQIYPGVDLGEPNSYGLLVAPILNSTDAQYTLPGRYVFTRTYAGGEEADYGLDSYSRSYTVYVDHNGIISVEELEHEGEWIREVGENISITLGKGTSDEYTFKNFFRTVPDGVILTSNKLPVQVNIPASKYFLQGSNAMTSAISTLNFAQLKVEMTYQATPTSPRTSINVTQVDSVNGFYFVIPELTNAGTYTLKINDHTGYRYTGTDPNVTQRTNIDPTQTQEYKFIIRHNAPTGKFFIDQGSNSQELIESIGGTNYATNLSNDPQNGVRFEWTDPADPYSAKISQIAITKTKQGASPQTSIINLTEESNSLNNYNISSMLHSIVKFDVVPTKTTPDEFEGKAYYQYRYILSLNIQDECTYSITLYYTTDAGHYFGTFVSTTYTLAIDRTKPNLNIDRLIDDDTYLLDAQYYISRQDIKDNFKEENASLSETTPTIYDYTFGVRDDFILNHNAAETLDYFYIRKYNKYNLDGTGQNTNISITPDNPYYNNFTEFTGYPRFNIIANTLGWQRLNYSNTTELSTLIYNLYGNADITGFYEIIERDLAGNYRAFTVYFGKNQTYSLLELTANDASGIQSTTGADITAARFLNISSYRVVLGWGTINLGPAVGSASISIKVTPYESSASLKYQNNLSTFNTYFSQINQSSNHLFNLKTSSFTQSNKMARIIVTDQKLPPPTIITNSNGTYTLRFPQKSNNNVLYLTRVYINTVRDFNIVPYYESADGSLNIPDYEQIEARSYYIKYTDNHNGDYEYIAHAGITQVPDNIKYRYYNDYYYEDSPTGDLYAGHDVSVTYQSVIHSVHLSINSSPAFEINSTSSPVSDFDYTNTPDSIYSTFKSFVLPRPAIENNYSASDTIGGKVLYTIYYRDKNGNLVETQNITIYNELPQIYLYDTNDVNIVANLTHTQMPVTNAAIRIDWAAPNYGEMPHSNIYRPAITVYRLNEDGSIMNSYSIANANHIISAPGYYRIQLSNDVFGNFRSVQFNIREGALPFYTVIDQVTQANLFASPIPLDLNTLTLAANDGGAWNAAQTGTTIYNSLVNRTTSAIDIDPAEREIILRKLGECSRTVNQYYSLNDARIQLDATRNFKIYSWRFINGAASAANPLSSDAVTTIYLIYGTEDPIYEEIIAVTKMPAKRNVVADGSLKYERPSATSSPATPITLSGFEAVLTNEDVLNGTATILWNTVSGRDRADDRRWYNSGNVVMLDYTYGNNSSVGNLGNFKLDGLTSKIQITGSGQHTLVFRDLAGNIAEFKRTYSYDYYRLIILDQVIFRVNGQTPVDHTVFNCPETNTPAVTITIDQLYTSYYANRTLGISIKRNGAYFYQNNDDNTQYQFNFREPGRYEVSLSANYRINPSIGIVASNALTTVTYNFVIIDPASSRLAYEFVEMSGYEVTRIIKDNVDITDTVKEYYIRQERESGSTAPITTEEISAFRLDKLFIGVQPFGQGRYTITAAVKYNELLAPRVYEYSFRISNSIPVLTSNPSAGGSTSGTITISYNPSSIFYQIGRSEIQILTYNKDTNRFEKFASYTITDSANRIETIELNQTNDYFVQLVTSSGNVVTSFRVNRTEPLNTLAIIVIVAVSVTVIVLTIVFIKLRTRMKVR